MVEKMASDLGVGTRELVGNPALVGQVRFEEFADAEQGLGRFTLDDIRSELERPGRDPRPDFKSPELRDDVTSIEDLKPGMELEGRVSNVANFGAFVDVGVKRDGLVHLSQLSDKWVDDPRAVVQVGQVVRVRVLEVDRARGRISLSMRSPEEAAPPGKQAKGPSKDGGKPRGGPGRPAAPRPAAPQRPAAPRGPATLEDLARKFNRRQ